MNGFRQNAGWRHAWGYTYYTDNDGRAVQGNQTIDGQAFDFGNDGTYYLRSTGYLFDGSSQNGGYRWYEDGKLYTGFRYYANTYYWFINGVRQNAGWREAWGYTYYTDGGNIYYANGDGNIVTDWQTIDGRNVHFWADGRLDTDSVNIDFGHWSLDQRVLGAPEGCEGVSFQMSLSAKGKPVPDIHDIYNRIGYGFGVSPYDGSHGNPFGYGQWYTQTVLAAPLAAKLNGAYGVETKDITGAGVGDVLSQLMANNLVITYLLWNLQLNNASNNFHVQLIYGYRDGGFLIADPLTIVRGANYWLSTSDWAYLNANVQPVGYGAPASMNVAVV
ncbi:C39 family peptidase [Fructobacillus fructosus]|uniref:C39 family peptidase n=1 Tax=Fructobacillus fructosus TaxID=1631 RepID=UPI001658922F|nr:C39 family peptidase [Fructobacillus fructosus]MBD9364928.1 C39 family peptidase [Leuconostoc mesenteroides]